MPVLVRLGLATKLHTLNPKACSVIELYGILDPITRDWTDGLLSNIFRDLNKPTDKNERRYILFDGDVDSLWVENMNSVMDDNKLLTLANGERIRLQKHCALLVEVQCTETLMCRGYTYTLSVCVVQWAIHVQISALDLCQCIMWHLHGADTSYVDAVVLTHWGEGRLCLVH